MIKEYSQEYQILMDSDTTVLDGNALSRIQNDYSIVLVRGFLGNVGAFVLGSYFQNHKKWLENKGIDAYIIDNIDGFDTENEPSLNISAINKLVEDTRKKHPSKKILFITHSKGGIDVLAMLLNHPDLLKNDIGGWIALQTPFEGTTLANIATFGVINQFFVQWALKLLGGSEEGLNSLRIDVRKEVIETSINGIEDIVKQIPILTFGSSFNSNDREILSLFMRFQSGPNDGVVPLDGTILRKDVAPLCSYIKAKPIDHLETVTQIRRIASFFNPKFDQQRFIDVLLKLWLEIN